MMRTCVGRIENRKQLGEQVGGITLMRQEATRKIKQEAFKWGNRNANVTLRGGRHIRECKVRN